MPRNGESQSFMALRAVGVLEVDIEGDRGRLGAVEDESREVSVRSDVVPQGDVLLSDGVPVAAHEQPDEWLLLTHS